MSSAAALALADLSWPAPSDGWALAARECKRRGCARLLSTSDGGAHWRSLRHAPPADHFGGSFACQARTCVSALSFANQSIGYLYGPGLLITTDGGRRWQAGHGLQVETLALSGRRAYRVAYRQTGCPGPCRPRLQVAAIGSSSWRTLIPVLATPGRSGQAQIAVSGRAVLVALYGSQAGPVSAHATVYRGSDDGRSWRRAGDPCADRGPRGRGEQDLVALAAAPGGFFAGLCTAHAGTSGGFIVTSTDAGSSWRAAGTLPRVQFPSVLAAASSRVLAVSTGPTSGSGPFTARLLVSTDAGRSWRLAARDRQRLTQAGTLAWLGFQSATVGRWVGDPHGVWVTHDAAARWTRVALG